MKIKFGQVEFGETFENKPDGMKLVKIKKPVPDMNDFSKYYGVAINLETWDSYNISFSTLVIVNR